jgi:phospholipid/cholesterol/gamma-HCH transport system substrate-binding protein
VIRRSVWVKTVVFVVIAALGVGYVLVHYVGAGQVVLGGRYTAYVDLRDSGGLFTTASVTYRGVEIGRVGAIKLRPDGIRVALDLASSPRIPADVDAVVGDGSPIGEQFVDLRPRSDRAPYLREGSVIPQARTSLPVSTQDLLVHLDRLVNSVPKDDLHTVVTELGTTFDRTGPALRTLLDSTHALVAASQQNLPQTVQLLHDGGTVLDTQNALGNDLVTFSRNLATFTDALRRSDPDLRAVIDNGIPASTQLIALDHSVDATLPVLLGNLVSLGQVTAVRIPALRQILIVYPYVVATSFGLFPGDGSTRFGVPVPPTEDHQPCLKGYVDPKKRRLPDVLTYPPVRWDAFCKEPTSADVNARGSREAPEPGGGRLGDQPGYMSNAGVPSGTNGATNSDYVLGSTGGEQRAMGDRSWTWLLFGPLS